MDVEDIPRCEFCDRALFDSDDIKYNCCTPCVRPRLASTDWKQKVPQPALSIVWYSCERCGLNEVPVMIREIRDGEQPARYIRNVIGRAIMHSHTVLSFLCDGQLKYEFEAPLVRLKDFELYENAVDDSFLDEDDA